MSQSATPTQREFVAEEFETSVTEETTTQLAREIEEIVRSLRRAIGDDDLIEELLRNRSRVLREADSVERSDPEPLTQQVFIEPLFDALNYPTLSLEAGDLSDQRGQQADYAASLNEYADIDSNRLLIEAEPVNKRLDQSKHGLSQVKDWLEKDKFEANLGMATDGLRWIFIKYDRDTYTHDTIAEVDLQPVVLAAFENLVGPNEATDVWLDDELRSIIEEFTRVFEFENFLSIAGDAPTVIKERKQAITDEFYDEYVQRVFGIGDGEDEPRSRSLIGEGIVAPPKATGDDIRLFAVELMNRLIFVKFLEDKELVDSGLLRSLQTAHSQGMHPDSFYKTFLEPLFFGVLDERPSERPERVRGMALYEDIPYLNGGLFRPTETGEGGIDDTDFDVRDSVLGSIINLLERYTFSADGGPTDLDPSILGNVFEKTINHITGDAGDQKKELGAYYTPDEITRFCAEETVRPALQERFEEVMIEQWGWTEEMADYDDVYALIEAVPDSNMDVIKSLLAEIESFRALDPACGSGHFLTSVQAEIVGIRKALYEGQEEEPDEWELRKQTVVENIYGVDIVEPAVEIAKLRLWLSIIAEVNIEEVREYSEDELALPNVVFNVRQGNSLIGYTDLMETSGDGDQARLSAWGPDSVRQRYGNIITKVSEHKRAETTEEAQRYLREAEKLLGEYRVDLDEKVLADFQEAGVENIDLERIREFEPFHWVLEFASVYADGGFDVVVGNPPWDQLRPSRDDYFSRFDERFRTRMPSDKDAKQEELLSDERIAEGWKDHQRNIEIQMRYFTDGSAYELQKPVVAGRKDPNENNLAALFLERVFNLVQENGSVAQVLPGVIFNGSFSKELRLKMLNDSNIRALVQFENHGIFEGLHAQYKFGIAVFENSGTTDVLTGLFDQRDISVLFDLDQQGLEIPRQVLEEYSPEARSFPFVKSKEEVDVLRKILSYPSLGENISEKWSGIPRRELDRARASDRFVEKSEGHYPVYGGKNIHQFHHGSELSEEIEPPVLWSVEENQPDKSAKYRVRERLFNNGNLKRAIYEQFGGTETNKSQKQFVNDLLSEYRKESLSEADVLPDFTEYRAVYRDISNSTNERTMIATVIPKGIVCVHTLQTFPAYNIEIEEKNLSDCPLHSAYKRAYSDRELFVLVGLLNSLPFDFLMRTKVDTHIVRYKFTESQMPRLTEGDDWFEYISSRAARLNCYGEAFVEMRERLGGINPATDPEERKRLQAEIDAAAFHAYGLDREETQFVCDDFHRVQNPRLMTDDYFDLVLEKYDELADNWIDAE
ncbi:N-6 DNA methylase [Halalkalicoccus paucihalophilus]|uniref:site-specific DNA-methyltransferase (adenine-specific) n=1 Tax=Halalkalicoccus paucihalophilus TaxID=1008153 RepID=A0A151A8P9_9EURY|nr:DNA methyltransferase [Halalkalicoccus paucihalophilus]KYH24015.1 N-6 DNA methylase [Halalkalicoccus paucihalophilus]